MTREERRDAGRFLKRHGYERKEDTKGFRSRIADRVKQRFNEAQERRRFKKSPAGMRQENERLALQARKETLKTTIHKAKKSRSSFGGGSMFGGSAPAPRRRRAPPRARQARASSYHETVSDSYSGGSGLNDMFGTGGQTRRPKKSSGGLSELF